MITGLITIAGAAILSANCSGKSHAEHHAGYVKPGAAITLSHDYDGQTAIGEFETVTAQLAHIYSDGLLSVDLLSPPDLRVTSTLTPQNSPIYSGSTLAIPIQFSSSIAGQYSISLQTVYESPDGHQSRRVVSIPVLIGSAPDGKAQSEAPYETKSLSGGLISLPAVEVIE